MKSIGVGVFANCKALTGALVLPEGLESIGNMAFYNCIYLKGTLTIPAAVKSIDGNAFAYCRNLTELVLEGEKTSQLETIGEMAFMGSGISGSLVIPESVTEIGEGAFANMGTLTELKLNSTMEEIPAHAFSGTTLSMEELAIPDSIQMIGARAFGWTNPRRVVLSTELRELGSIDAREPEDSPFCYSDRTEELVFIATEVPDIYGDFTSMTALTTIWVPQESQEDYTTALTSLVNENVQILPLPPLSGSCGENVSWKYDIKTGTLTIIGAGDTYDYAHFNNVSPWACWSEDITRVVVESGVTRLGNCTFRPHNDGYKKLTSVELADSVASLGNAAFLNLSTLTSIDLSHVTELGSDVFNGCGSLETVVFNEDLQSIAASAFTGCGALKNVQLPKNLKRIEVAAFTQCYNAFVDLVVPEGVTAIGNMAFYECVSMESAVLPKSLQTINAEAFSTNPNLKEITFLSSAPGIGESVFQEVNATVYYPGDDVTWTSSVRQNYGGTITWEAYCSGIHKYGQPAFAWQGNSACTAAFACDLCGESQSVSCIVSVETVPATEHREGSITYTATASFGGKKYTDTKVEGIPKKEHIHSYADNWSSDGDHHWKMCTVCGGKKDISAHTPGEVAGENTSQKCTVCGHVLRPPMGLDWFFDRAEEENFLTSGFFAEIMERYG